MKALADRSFDESGLLVDLTLDSKKTYAKPNRCWSTRLGPNENSSNQLDSSNRSSQCLIGLVEKNDADAWDRLVFLYSPVVYYRCHASGLPSQEMPDVFQEVSHTVARTICKFTHDQNGTFRGWLRTLTRNKVTGHYRKTGHEPRPTGGSFHESECDPSGKIESSQTTPPGILRFRGLGIVIGREKCNPATFIIHESYGS